MGGQSTDERMKERTNGWSETDRPTLFGGKEGILARSIFFHWFAKPDSGLNNKKRAPASASHRLLHSLTAPTWSCASARDLGHPPAAASAHPAPFASSARARASRGTWRRRC